MYHGKPQKGRFWRSEDLVTDNSLFVLFLLFLSLCPDPFRAAFMNINSGFEVIAWMPAFPEKHA